MPYLHLQPNPTLGYLGCGPDCRCTLCHEKGSSTFVGEAGASLQPTGPIFRLECPAGCAPVTAAQCRNVLRQAIIEAIKLANNAATRVEAASKLQPSQRDATARETARLFKFFFGHDPTHPVPWAGNEASGVSVAYRFRAVARELGGGRRIIFRCLVSRPDCADDDFTCCLPDDNAWVNQARVPNVVHLCPRFWHPPAGLRGLPPPSYRAGVIIHEMLHLLFQSFLLHHPPGRPNAHCYEAFALRVAGFGADPFDVRQCTERLAAISGWGVGNTPTRTPWRVRLGLRSTPQYLRFMNLDQFNWNKASLTPHLIQMVRQLAEHVKLSWQSMRPIGYIRLIGHSDNTGKHDYNIKLGNRRAQAVKEALENLLKEDILKRRIAILVEESPGELNWIADNRTPQGRALNRRVEVFIAPPEPSPPKLPPPPPPPVIQTTPGPYPWGKLPTLPPGKSLKQFVDDWLGKRRVPKWLRKRIWDAITGKSFGVVSNLLNAAGISGPEKEAFVETVRILAETPTR